VNSLSGAIKASVDAPHRPIGVQRKFVYLFFATILSELDLHLEIKGNGRKESNEQ
jgi:hypothetical protein